MARKADIRRVERIAAQFGMTAEERRDFGDYLEECKRSGDCGTANERGDFTWQEMEQKAREFMGIADETGEGQT